jgi:phage shock protein A
MSINQVIKAAQAFSDSKTAALKKSLDAERKDKEELKRLNQQLIGKVHQLQRQLQDAKDQHEEWRVKYSKALSEKIALLRPYEVSLAHPAVYHI